MMARPVEESDFGLMILDCRFQIETSRLLAHFQSAICNLQSSISNPQNLPANAAKNNPVYAAMTSNTINAPDDSMLSRLNGRAHAPITSHRTPTNSATPQNGSNTTAISGP
jgi:hypothetical protein